MSRLGNSGLILHLIHGVIIMWERTNDYLYEIDE